MNDPIDRLLAEHQEIMAQVADLRRAVRDLEQRGEAALAGAMPVLEAVGRMMATRLSTHARKEDEALFPALERLFGPEGGPTTVMRAEHREIHAQAESFRNTLRELNEVEHPAIVAHGETLREQTKTGARAEDLRATGAEIISLIDLHFRKEENVLFPMARHLLDAGALGEVGRRMEEIEAEAAA